MIRSPQPVLGEGSPFDIPPAALGRYRVLQQIAAGSSGPVFRAEDPASEQPVAIKLFRLELTPARARELARDLLALGDQVPSHPAVAPILDAGLHAELAFLVTGWRLGAPLDAALAEYGPAAITDALPRLSALAGALDAAAARGLCHGALHPRDVLVAAEDTALVGLGLATLLEGCGVRIPARPPYTAPETVEGHAALPRADQFALAAIAHEWLFGRSIAGPAESGIDVPALPGVNRARLASAFATALDREPRKRFANAAGFVAALSGALTDSAGRSGSSRSTAAARQHATAPLPLDEDESPGAVGPMRVADAEIVRPPAAALTGDLRLRDAAAEASELVLGWEPAVDEEGDTGRSEDVPLAEESATGRAPALVPRSTGKAADQDTAAPPPPPSSIPAPGQGGDARRYGDGALAAAVLLGLSIGAAGGFMAGRGTAPVTSGDARALDRSSPPAAVLEITEEEIQPPEDGVPATRPAPSASVAGTRPSVPDGRSPSSPEGPGFSPGTGSPGTIRPGTTSRDAPAVPRQEPSRATAAPPSSVPARGTPRPPATTGSLRVESRPAGASVTVNGRTAGVTPLTISDVAPGRHTVRLERSGYRPWTTTVQVTAGERVRVAASLVGGQGQE